MSEFKQMVVPSAIFGVGSLMHPCIAKIVCIVLLGFVDANLLAYACRRWQSCLFATAIWGAVLFAADSRYASAASIYQQTVLADSPLVYWTLDEAIGSTRASNMGSEATSLDGTHHSVTLGQTVATPGLGTAAYFNGVSSYVELAEPISTWLNHTSSLEFWIKTTQASQQDWQSPGIAGEDNSGDPWDLFWGINKGGRVGLQRGNGDDEVVLTPQPINDDVWHHLVITRDQPTGFVNIYLDGNPNPVTSYDGVNDLNITTSYSRIGRGNYTASGFFQGSLDEVAVYDHVLTGDRVQAHYAAAVPEPSTFALLGISTFGLLCYARRKTKKVAFLCFVLCPSIGFLSVPEANATLYAYEGFDYSVGATLNGRNGDSGFSNAWIVTGNNFYAIGEGSLTDSSGRLVTSGNSLTNTGYQPTTRRDMQTSVGAPGTTIYVSCLLQKTDDREGWGGIILGGSNTEDPFTVFGLGGLFIGGSRDYPYGLAQAGTADGVASLDPVVVGQTALLVTRIDFRDGLDKATLYVNPALDSEPANGLVWEELDLGLFSQISITQGNGSAWKTDELRVATAWAEATPTVPEPSTFALLGLGTISLLAYGWRRRNAASGMC